MASFELIVLSGASLGDKFSFEIPLAGVVIGRSTDCELVLQDPLVSRKHAKVFIKDDQMMICDLGSSHGSIHMGFRLEPGEEKARTLSSDDEFKLGDSLFRISFKEVEKPKQSIEATSEKRAFKKKLPLILVSAVAILGVVFLLTSEEESTIPEQRSGELLTLPEKGSLGFIANGDQTHADKVQIDLPPADGVLEYDFYSGGTTHVYLDGVKIESLPKTDGGWEQRLLLVRDPVGGKERRLVFDEERNTADTVAQMKPLTQWGVKNLRFTNLPYFEGKSSDDALTGALALAELLGRSSNSLYLLAKGLERAGLLLLRESGFDAQGVTIERESGRPDSELLKLKLEGLILERKGVLEPGAVLRQFKVIYEMIGVCEAELWRKFTIDMRQAVTDSKAKDYITAHDRLLAVQTMIGDELDYRHKKAGEFLDDRSIVPAKVRKNPYRYRREKD